MRFPRLFAAGLLSVLVVLSQAFAQSYPSRPIRMIIPTTTGGTLDTLARVTAQSMSESLKQPIVVDNRPGASGTIANDLAAKSPADGYTVLFGTSGTFASNAAINKKLPFDVVADFAPLSIVAESTFVLAVHPSLPATTLQEFIALAKSRPDQISYGSFGIGSIGHFLTESFSQSAGVKLFHVPYKSAPDSLNALVAGQVVSSIDALTVIWPQARANRLRILAVGRTKRSALAPDIPTFSEAGFPGFTATVWYGLFAPANTPREIVMKLNSEIVQSLARVETRERLEKIGMLPVGSTPEQFALQLRSDLDMFIKVARDAKITAE